MGIAPYTLLCDPTEVLGHPRRTANTACMTGGTTQYEANADAAINAIDTLLVAARTAAECARRKVVKDLWNQRRRTPVVHHPMGLARRPTPS